MINYLSLFSGIGAFEKAMLNQDIPFNLVGYSEIDKYASKSYSAIFDINESMNLGDITKIDESTLPPIDFITYGFPCQDISLAGKQKGLFNEDGTQTRSGLFFDALRIIEATQPKVAIAENVKNLCSKKFSEQFKIVLDSLEEAGYNNYWKILNSKDYGIPQNRERVFIVSIRKDCDTGVFEFPEGYQLEKRLKDMLEDEVDEKFYVSNKMVDYLINTKFRQDADTLQRGDVCKCLRVGGTTPCVEEQPVLIGGMQKNQSVKTDGVCTTLTSSMGTGGGYVPMVTEPLRLGNIYGEQYGTGYAGNVWDKEAISPTLMTMQGGNRQPLVVVNVGNVNPSGKGQNGQVVDSEGLARTITQEKGEGQKILVRTNNKKGYDEALEGDYINIERPGSTTRRGRVGHGVSQTLDTKENHCVVSPSLRIRKLTPKECFRLMGFDDESFHKAESVCSNTQLYKQAGNSIVVDVAEEILCMMFDEDGNFFI